MNGITRNFITHTDRKAPSKDVARRFASYQFAVHIADGGFFSVDGRTYQQAGKSILALQDEPSMKKLIFGGVTRAASTPFVLKGSKWNNARRRQFCWEQVMLTRASFQEFIGHNIENDVTIEKFHGVVNSQGRLQSISSSFEGPDYKGRIEEILKVDDVPVIVVRRYRPLNRVDSLGCEKFELEDYLIPLQPEKIVSAICMVHDCVESGCQKGQTFASVVQERVDIRRMRNVWHHTDSKFFVFNRFRFGELEELWEFNDNEEDFTVVSILYIYHRTHCVKNALKIGVSSL